MRHINETLHYGILFPQDKGNIKLELTEFSDID